MPSTGSLVLLLESMDSSRWRVFHLEATSKLSLQAQARQSSESLKERDWLVSALAPGLYLQYGRLQFVMADLLLF